MFEGGWRAGRRGEGQGTGWRRAPPSVPCWASVMGTGPLQASGEELCGGACKQSINTCPVAVLCNAWNVLVSSRHTLTYYCEPPPLRRLVFRRGL